MLQGALATTALGAASACSPVLRRAVLAPPPAQVPFGVRSFVRKAYDGLDRRQVWDSHAHVIGNGATGSGAYVNPAYREEFYKSFLYDFYMAHAGGLVDEKTAELDYIRRVLNLHRMANPQGRMVLLAFDYRVDDQGEEQPEHTEFAVPNAFVQGLAAKEPDLEWGCSVHPYRKDALDRLDDAVDKGAVCVKWLPNAMGIDPADKKCIPFYKRAAEHGIPLLVHAGEEQAADSEGSQRLGDVLRLRLALDHGAKIIVAHCAGLGEGEDLDAGHGVMADSFDLMVRLLDEKQWEGQLYADISAMTQFNRCGRPLREIILRQDLHHRLLNGSDFPLPALNLLVSTRYLEKLGYITRHQRQQCNEVFKVNPLLFDFVVKRALRVRHEGKDYAFKDIVFESARAFTKS